MAPYYYVRKEEEIKKRSENLCEISKLMGEQPEDIRLLILSKLATTVFLSCYNPKPVIFTPGDFIADRRVPATRIISCYNPKPVIFTTYDDDSVLDRRLPRLCRNSTSTTKEDVVEKSSSSLYTTFFAYSPDLIYTVLVDYDPRDHRVKEFRIRNMDAIIKSSISKGVSVSSNPNVVASCNGWLLVLLLLRNTCDPHLGRLIATYASLRLLNPITRQCVVLPDSPSHPQNDFYGLGYGSKTGKLNVVSLIISPSIMAEVWTIDEGGGRGKGWEIIKNRADPNKRISSVLSGTVCLDGALHWLVHYYDRNNNNLPSYTCILRYDFDLKKFEFVDTPTPAPGKTASHLGVIGDGLLYVGAYDKLFDKTMDIWVMKQLNGAKKSWTSFAVMKGLDCSFNRTCIVSNNFKNSSLLMLSFVSFGKLYVDVYDGEERVRDRTRRVPLLEWIDVDTRNTMTIEHYYVPKFLHKECIEDLNKKWSN